MRRLLFCLASVAAIGAAHAAGKIPDVIPIDQGWHISLDAQGHLTSLQAIPDKRLDRVPQIRARLEQEIRGWQFLPGTIDGKPQPTDSALFVHATLTKVSDENYSIRVDQAHTGSSGVTVVPPHYPRTAVISHTVGEVVLRIGYDADGGVTSVALDPEAPKVAKSLVEASIDAAKQWKFKPENVGGHSVAGYVIVPFCFNLRYVGGGGKSSKCDWKRSGSNEALDDGKALAVNPAAKLLTDVAGRAL